MNQLVWQVAVTIVLAARMAQGEITAAAAEPAAPAGAGGPAPAATAAAATGDADTDVLTFQNGDRLHGLLESIAPTGLSPSVSRGKAGGIKISAEPTFGLQWKSSVMATPAVFSLAPLDRVRFGRKSVSEARTPQCQIRLSNDDSLRGELASLEGDAMVLKTSYAGNVSLRRSMIAQIWPGKGLSGVVYEGPEDMSGWVIGNSGRMRGTWNVKDGYLLCMSQYPIGREIKDLPDVAEIQIEVSTSGQYLQMSVGFCAENLQSMGNGNMYFLQFSGNSGYLYRCANNSGSRNLGQNFQYDNGRGMPLRKATVRIFLNRSKKQIALVLNGQFIRQWTDPDGFPGTGKGLLFQCQDGMRYKIGNIKVAAWDGRIPQSGDTGDSQAATDTMVLANGDKISGKVTSIKGGTVKFETSYAPLDVPMDRITEISLGKDGRQKARLNKNDIQCQFAGGGTLTLDLVTLDSGQIAGKSENFGDIKLSVSALEGIRFNPWSRPAEESKDGSSGGPDGGGFVEVED